MEEHLDAESLRRFWRGLLPREAEIQLIQHAIDCPLACWRLFHLSQFDTTPPWPDQSLPPSQVLPAEPSEDERAEEKDLVHCLLKLDPARRLLVLRNHPRYHRAAVCLQLIAESHDARFEDHARMLDLARMAVVLVEVLDPVVWGGFRALADLKARAYAHLGNALRVNNECGPAQQAFVETNAWLVAGTGDPVLQARVWDLEASLWKTMGRHVEAIGLLDKVYETYVAAGDHQLAAMALINKAEFLRDKADYQGNRTDRSLALLAYQEALVMIDAVRDPEWLWVAVYGCARLFVDLGDLAGAQHLAAQAKVLCQGLDRPLQKVRQRWLQACIATLGGQTYTAIRLLTELREEFLARDLGLDAALAALDLAKIYARQGRASELRRLAQEMIPVFRKQDVHREAQVALGFFCQAAKQEIVSLAIVDQVARFLQRSRQDRSLRFVPQPD